MKIIYVCGPYRAAHTYQVKLNIMDAELLGIEVIKLGAYVVVPHKNTEYLDGLQSDEFYLNGTLELMKRCDGLIVLPRWRSSQGSIKEVEIAHQLDIPVFTSLDKLKSWLQSEEAKNEKVAT